MDHSNDLVHKLHIPQVTPAYITLPLNSSEEVHCKGHEFQNLKPQVVTLELDVTTLYVEHCSHCWEKQCDC